MSRLLPEMAFYTPLHFVVYEDDAGKIFVAYDTFVSLLAQYQREEITQAGRGWWSRSWKRSSPL